jgi:tRNA 2-thiocytidine biosynthesis protein TtcA
MLDDSDDIHPLFAGAPRTTKLRKRIVRQVREAIEQYGMIERKGGTPPNGWSACRAARTATRCSPSFTS